MRYSTDITCVFEQLSAQSIYYTIFKLNGIIQLYFSLYLDFKLGKIIKRQEEHGKIKLQVQNHILNKIIICHMKKSTCTI